ncbi:transglycosylase SLT domain-containing protein [Novosphingobium panipatense]|uniref:transglycosylase SLT domain-containing protein n=1 Tax=Novosphingobium panipatense TaxID=428991 RepID=UPI00361DEDDF
MIVSLAIALDLARQCAPSVAPATILAIAHAESELDTLAINVNGGPKLRPATSAADAAALARSYIAAGYSVDLGLGQINSNNLGWLGLSVEDTFDPCRNLAAAARVISLNYSTAARGARVGRKQWGSRFRFIIPGSRAGDLPTAMWRAFTARPRLSRVDLARRHRPRRQRLREEGALPRSRQRYPRRLPRSFKPHPHGTCSRGPPRQRSSSAAPRKPRSFKEK